MKRISLDAGSNLNCIESIFSSDTDDSLEIAIGIIKGCEPGMVRHSKESGILRFWDPEHSDDGIIGATVLFNPVKLIKCLKQQTIG